MIRIRKRDDDWMNGYRIRIRNLLILLISYEKRGKILRALSIGEMAKDNFL